LDYEDRWIHDYDAFLFSINHNSRLPIKKGDESNAFHCIDDDEFLFKFGLESSIAISANSNKIKESYCLNEDSYIYPDG
jgi:hypothetical protein